MASDRTRESLRGAFIAILAATIGALGTLAGNQLANANAREQLSVQLSHDDGVRQYESRRDTYTEFISAASQARMNLIRVVLHDTNTGQSTSEAELKEVLGDNAQVTALCSNIQVLGSTKAATLAVAVRDAFDRIVSSDNMPGDQLLDEADAIKLKVRAFVDAAHDDLN